MFKPRDDEEGAQPGMVHRVVNAASVVVWLPFDPCGCARPKSLLLTRPNNYGAMISMR
jgi:hypothetical protein